MDDTEMQARIGACIEENSIPYVTPGLCGDAAALAHEYVRTSRLKRRAAATVKASNAALAKMVDPILDHMKLNRWPTSGKVDGANLHRKLELYASPAEVSIGGESFHDHAALTAVIEQLARDYPNDNWAALLPGKVNGNSLAATFREYLANADLTIEQQLLPVDERLLAAGCPATLVAAAKITEKHTVAANSL